MDIRKPVTLISFAAALVGDKQLQKAYQYLEKDGIVRYLRVSVREDYVPTVPISSPSILDWGKLNEDRPPELKHSFGMKTPARNETKWAWETLPWQTITMYDFRLDQSAGDLRCKQLDELYQDSEFLGAFSAFI